MQCNVVVNVWSIRCAAAGIWSAWVRVWHERNLELPRTSRNTHAVMAEIAGCGVAVAKKVGYCELNASRLGATQHDLALLRDGWHRKQQQTNEHTHTI
jgi:hypothetical protein